MNTFRLDRTANATLQNTINRSIIFNYLRHRGPAYRAQISKDLGISAPAVSRVVDSLIEEAYIVESKKIITASGKRPTQIEVNCRKGKIIAVDLIKAQVRIAVCDFSGKVVNSFGGFKLVESLQIGQKLVETLGEVIQSCCADSEVMAIAIGIPAAIDLKTGAVTDAPLYNNLNGLNLKKLLEQELKVPVFVDNIVKLCALAEKVYGEGRACENLVFVEISEGIGAGIIMDNHLIRGASGLAGELGFSIINTENLEFKARTKGFLESVASVESLQERALEAIQSGKATKMLDLTRGDPADVHPATVCEAAYHDDCVAQEIVSDIVRYLSVAIVQLILILDPQLVVLGGDMSALPHVEELFIQPICEHVQRVLPFASPKIKISSLMDKAGIMGASFLAIESSLAGKFPYTYDYGFFG